MGLLEMQCVCVFFFANDIDFSCDAYHYTEYLVGAGGADVCSADQNKNTALHVACRQVRSLALSFVSRIA